MTPTSLNLLSMGTLLGAAAANLIGALVVLVGARDRRVGRNVAAATFFAAIWSLVIGLQSVPNFDERHHEVVYYLRLLVFFLPAVVFQTATALAESRERWRLIIRLGYGVGLALAVLYLNGLIVSGEIHYTWGSMAKPGRLFFLFPIYSATWLIGSLLVCWKALRTPAAPEIQLRVKYLFFGLGCAVPTGLLSLLGNYGIPAVPFGGVGIMLYSAVMGYAVVRHRVMDIDAFVVRVAGSVFSLAVVALPLLALVLVLQWHVMGEISAIVSAGAALSIVVAMGAYARVRARIERVIEDSFFPSRRQGRRAIEDFSRRVVELAHSNLLGTQLTSTLTECLGLVGAALYTANGPVFRREARSGEIRGPMTIEAASLSGLEPPSSPHGWELCVPLGSNGQTLGFIALGAKRSAAAIDDLDRTLLTMVASQVAVALKNTDYVRQLEAQKTAIERQRDAIEQQKTEIEALQRRLQAENTALRAEVRSVSGFGDIVGQSPALQRVLDLIEKTARSDASILVTGETGTGKELIARAVHELSERRSGPLISVNCPAIPHDLAEAELFGCERGAFTGATESRAGRFELADGGTVFLDEVADLPMAVQTKLLRVLQEREVQRLGSRRTRKVDVRVVAATNRDLRQAIARGEFRPDLYHRLAGVVAELPPLRERAGDIEMLATYFLDRAAKTHRKPITAFGEAAMQALCSYNWPGNVRELQNVIERAVLLCGGQVIAPEHLGDLVLSSFAAEGSGLRSAIREEKARRVEEALAAANGNITAAARILGVSRSNLSRLIKNLGLRRSGLVQ